MPTLSREDLAIEAYLNACPVKHVVTATLGTYVNPSNPCSPHSPRSLHCAPGTDGQGRAVDFADAIGNWTAQGLLAIFSAFGPVESQIAELIYAAAPYCIFKGKRVNGWQVYGSAVMQEHYNHVHVGVDLGVFLAPITETQAMARVPNPVAAHHRPGAGPEQFAVMALDGAMYTYNGAPYCDAYNAHSNLWGGASPNTNRAGVDFNWDDDGWGWTQYMDDGAFYHWRAAGH